jgi:hypothetical protein
MNVAGQAPTGSLRFDDFERVTSRLFATQISANQLELARAGRLVLPLTDAYMAFWSKCLVARYGAAPSSVARYRAAPASLARRRRSRVAALRASIANAD